MDDFINATEAEAWLAIMDRLGVRVTPAGPNPWEVW